MKKLLILIISFFLLAFSFDEEKGKIDRNLLCKIWRFDKVENRPYPIYHYKISDSIGDFTAYEFKKSSNLITRQPTSWCFVGESNIKFETVKGKWQFIADSIIELKHLRYNKKTKQKYRILKLTDKELVLSVKITNGL
jgi:predicted RNA-binding protein